MDLTAGLLNWFKCSWTSKVCWEMLPPLPAADENGRNKSDNTHKYTTMVAMKITLLISKLINCTLWKQANQLREREIDGDGEGRCLSNALQMLGLTIQKTPPHQTLSFAYNKTTNLMWGVVSKHEWKGKKAFFLSPQESKRSSPRRLV